MPPGLTSPVHLFVIVVVALVVLGPEQLPGALRQVGRFLAEVRRWRESLQTELQEALSVEPERAPSLPGPPPTQEQP